MIPMTTKIGRGMTYHELVPPTNTHDSLIAGSCEIRGNLKALYLHYRKAYGHKTWQDGDLP